LELVFARSQPQLAASRGIAHIQQRFGRVRSATWLRPTGSPKLAGRLPPSERQGSCETIPASETRNDAKNDRWRRIICERELASAQQTSIRFSPLRTSIPLLMNLPIHPRLGISHNRLIHLLHFGLPTHVPMRLGKTCENPGEDWRK